MSKTTVLNPKKPYVMGWVAVISGPCQGRDFKLREGRNDIGSGADVHHRLEGEGISGSHVTIVWEDRKFTLVDLVSTNGTFVNGGTEPVTRVDLNDGDRFRIGTSTLVFKCII